MVVCNIQAARTIDSHLTDADLQRLQQVFADALKSSDIQSVYYGAAGSKMASPADKKEACAHITKLYKDSKLNEFEKNFYLAATYKLFTCPSPIAESAQDSMTLKKEFTTTQEMYYNYFASKALAVVVTDDTKLALAKNIATILKKDDSLNSVGHAFHVAAELGSSAATPIAEWIEGIFAQADEIDGKMLQFEGGLSTTALIINGAFRLTKALGKPTPINEEQTVKFTNYLLSRRSVQVAKGASTLIEALNTITANAKLVPVSIQAIGNGLLQPDAPVLSVKIVNALGAAVQPAIASVSAVVSTGGKVFLAKTELIARSSDKSVFTLDLAAAKPSRGLYSVEVQADAYKQVLPVKVLGKVKVQTLEIGVGESDSTSSVKKQSVEYPRKLTTELNGDAQQKVVLRAVLMDEGTGKPLYVHQAFVRLENRASKEEIIFVAEKDSSHAYKFEMVSNNLVSFIYFIN